MHPLVPGILLAIIPKCPFCIIAYSSALTIFNLNSAYTSLEVMCNGTIQPEYWWQEPALWYAGFGLLSLVFLLSLARNYTGRKTKIALILGFVGIGILLLNLLAVISGGLILGVIFLLAASALNTYLPVLFGKLWQKTVMFLGNVYLKYANRKL